MTDVSLNGGPLQRRLPTAQELSPERVRKRYAAERRFRYYGAAAILAAVAILAILMISIVSKGYSAFVQTEIALEITFDPEAIDPTGERDPEVLASANYMPLIRDALSKVFPEVTGRRDKRNLRRLVSTGSPFELGDLVKNNPDLIGTTQTVWVAASAKIDGVIKGQISRDVPESDRIVSDQELAWLDTLESRGQVETKFNTRLFSAGDSREPEQAGIWGAAVGSMLTLFVTFMLSFPIAVLSAIYLEEFAPKNRVTDVIEVNINNLAAVPSIVFGLLGLAVFLNVFGMPRSAPLVGGMVLALMTLPTIIIAARAALKAVPPSIREAALGVGASKHQVVWHHVLPLAMPGILTGTIIGLAQALGETAPLLMIGMVAFIVDIPGGFTDPSTVLPVQIYIWADSPERAFVERTSAAIMVLLTFLVAMNALAVFLRKRFERRW